MCVRKISIDSDRSTQPSHCVLVAAEIELGDPSRRKPIEGKNVTRTDAKRSRTWPSVSSASPLKSLAIPIVACAAAKLRSSSNARSHSAIAWRPWLAQISTRPKIRWANAWAGAKYGALFNAVFAVSRRAVLSPVVYADANVISTQALPASAPTLSGVRSGVGGSRRPATCGSRRSSPALRDL